jgi:hypothetical protein
LDARIIRIAEKFFFEEDGQLFRLKFRSPALIGRYLKCCLRDYGNTVASRRIAEQAKRARARRRINYLQHHAEVSKPIPRLTGSFTTS